MNRVKVPGEREQAAATRFGYLVAVVASLCIFSCLAGVWFLFARDSLEILQTSWHLRSNGVLTTGTIIDLEEVPGVRPDSSATYRLIVAYEVDGTTYAVKSLKPYPVPEYNRGDSIQVIYDPDNPEISQVDIFYERWIFPFFEGNLL
jgi:hypothetical protein